MREPVVGGEGKRGEVPGKAWGARGSPSEGTAASGRPPAEGEDRGLRRREEVRARGAAGGGGKPVAILETLRERGGPPGVGRVGRRERCCGGRRGGGPRHGLRERGRGG